MAMGRRKGEQQGQMFIATADLPATAGHPFYERLNAALRAIEFDRRCEEACAKFYHEKLGRPGIAPGVCVRMLLIGYFEGIDSARDIAWRVSDSLSLRRFLGTTCRRTRRTTLRFAGCASGWIPRRTRWCSGSCLRH